MPVAATAPLSSTSNRHFPSTPKPARLAPDVLARFAVALHFLRFGWRRIVGGLARSPAKAGIDQCQLRGLRPQPIKHVEACQRSIAVATSFQTIARERE